MKKTLLSLTSLALLIALSLPALAQQKPVDPIKKLQNEARAAGQQAAAQTLEPNEINNIGYRRTLMGKPGLVMYVVFLSKSGQPIDYFTTDGKCTSSHKRLTPPMKLVDVKNTNSILVPAVGADGTYGSSGDYIYCFTTSGIYKQWSGNYYASDAPIELQIKPLVVDLGNKIQAQE